MQAQSPSYVPIKADHACAHIFGVTQIDQEGGQGANDKTRYSDEAIFLPKTSSLNLSHLHTSVLLFFQGQFFVLQLASFFTSLHDSITLFSPL